MYKKFIGVILAKKNSQRLRNKNLVKIGNKHLVEYPMKSFNKSKYISRFILSSDSKQILSFVLKLFSFAPHCLFKKFAFHIACLCFFVDHSDILHIYQNADKTN